MPWAVPVMSDGPGQLRASLPSMTPERSTRVTNKLGVPCRSLPVCSCEGQHLLRTLFCHPDRSLYEIRSMVLISSSLEKPRHMDHAGSM